MPGRSLFLYDLDVFGERRGAVVAMPCDAIVGLHSVCHRAKNDTGMRRILDLLAGKRHTQTLGDEGHDAGLELHVLQDAGREAARLAEAVEPGARPGDASARTS